MDLRTGVNAISDVVNNRPKPIRSFDQIFMKTADMFLQTEHVSRKFDGKEIVFIGDGDAIGLCLVHLHQSRVLPTGPAHVHVLDFDERVVFSIRRFAKDNGLSQRISSELYNIADPLPRRLWQRFDGFYTNPPFGASNEGESVRAFLRRGSEAVGKDAIGCLVVADDRRHPWTLRVLTATQRAAFENGFIISELIPEFHHYHLDDAPDLTSCSLVIRRIEYKKSKYDSKPLSQAKVGDFYGRKKPLLVRYVRDLTTGERFGSNDYEFELMTEAKSK